VPTDPQCVTRAGGGNEQQRASLALFAQVSLGIVETVLRFMGNDITTPTVVLIALLLISGSQFTLFAMWFDMESNKDLK